MLFFEDRQANSLFCKRLSRKGDLCGWSNKYRVIIHRFDMGERTCRCGKVTVLKKETSGGWKKTPKE